MFLCTCRMQLWQPCQNFFVKTLNTLCSNSGNDGKKSNFPKNLFFLKMFVWTCTKRFWQDCRNFVSRNTKEFPIVQIRWSYNFSIRNCFHQKWFSSNGDCNFDNPTKNFSPKNHRFVTQIPKGREKLWTFWKENYFSSNCASAQVESICDHPVKHLSSKPWKVFARIRKRMKNLCAFQTKYFLPKMFVWTCTMKFWPAFRNFVAKKTKNFPELQKCWSYTFLNKFIFFIKNDSLATENAILTTVANNFFLRVHTFAAQIPKTTRKNFELFERKITFLKMFLCTCRMQFWQPSQKFFSKSQQATDLSLRFQKRKRKIMNFLEGKLFSLKLCFCTCRIHLWPPREKFVFKTLKSFARIPERMKNLCAFQTKYFLPKMFVWTCTMKFWPAFRNFVAKKTKNFPELQNCWSYNFLNKFIFFIRNDSLATENAILTTVANIFLWESTHLQLRFRKPRKKTLNFSRGK